MSRVRLFGGAISFAVTIAVAAVLTNRAVPEPYMDEIFHIPQVRRFYEGDMSWDPKITTPPGLYFVTMFIWRVGRLLGFTLDAQPVAQARVTNLLGILLLPWVCAVAQTNSPSLLRWRIAYVCTALPPLWFFGLLYYTDVWSVCSILAAAAAAVRRQHALASLCATASLFFRQNNIVWILFVLGATVLGKLERFTRPPRHSVALLRTLRRRDAQLAVLFGTAPYLVPILGFVAFLIWNDGSVVLGDRENHAMVFHLAQIGYFFAFALVFGWPVVLREIFVNGRRLVRRPAVLLGAAVATALGLYAVHAHSYAHPFLLADNRHYTFYVWRRIINARPWARYALVPVYVASATVWIQALARLRNALWIFGWLLATSLILVPSPLIEPRYMVVPYILMRVSVDAGGRCAMVEVAWAALVNITTLLIFLYRPFRWAGSTELQRFMW